MLVFKARHDIHIHTRNAAYKCFTLLGDRSAVSFLVCLQDFVMSDKCCVVYVNPHGAPIHMLDRVKEDVLTAEESDHLPDSVECSQHRWDLSRNFGKSQKSS